MLAVPIRHCGLKNIETQVVDPHAMTGAGIRYGSFHLIEELRKSVEIACERSEEHTSELQSLMRISYAVFCLKKKNMKRHILQKKCTTTTQKCTVTGISHQ